MVTVMSFSTWDQIRLKDEKDRLVYISVDYVYYQLVAQPIQSRRMHLNALGFANRLLSFATSTGNEHLNVSP